MCASRGIWSEGGILGLFFEAPKGERAQWHNFRACSGPATHGTAAASIARLGFHGNLWLTDGQGLERAFHAHHVVRAALTVAVDARVSRRAVAVEFCLDGRLVRHIAAGDEERDVFAPAIFEVDVEHP